MTDHSLTHMHTKYNYIEFIVSYVCVCVCVCVCMVACVCDGERDTERKRMCVCLYEIICKSFFSFQSSSDSHYIINVP
jgi:hypothetical protein